MAAIAKRAFGLDPADSAGFLRGEDELEDLEAKGVPTGCLRRARSRVTRGKEGETETREIEIQDSLRALEILARILPMDAAVAEPEPERPEVVSRFVKNLQLVLAEKTTKRYHPNLPSAMEVMAAHGVGPYGDDGEQDDDRTQRAHRRYPGNETEDD